MKTLQNIYRINSLLNKKKILLILFSFVAWSSAWSQLQIYTDRDAWEEALAGTTVDIDWSESSIDSDLYTLCTGNNPEDAEVIGTHTFIPISCLYSATYLDFVTPATILSGVPYIYWSGTTAGTPKTRISIPSSYAIGFDWQTKNGYTSTGLHNSFYLKVQGAGSCGSLTRLLNPKNPDGIVPGGLTSGFIGIISPNGGINSYDLYTNYTNFGWYAASNFSYSTDAIPSTPSDEPTISATTNPLCSGDPTTLAIASGNLNDADNWKWYSSSCGGSLIGTGTSVVVNPGSTTTYYARGEGCNTSPGSCGSITVDVIPLWYLDADTDGYYTDTPICSLDSPGTDYTTTAIAGDCNDDNAAVNPGATEILGNDIDDNCDGLVDILPYCDFYAYYSCYYMWISNVTLGDINNDTECGTNGYSNYLGINTQLNPGEEYTISVSGNNQYSQYASVFIDWNLDGDFYDADELVASYIFLHYSGNPGSATFTVPPTATGSYTMRVTSEYYYYYYPNNQCFSNYGEAEDYTLITCEDPDGDEVCSNVDNCPDITNPDQQDSDSDGQGDVCDICPFDADNDIDDDGVCGDVDNCPLIANPEQEDIDLDGIGDACDDTTSICDAIEGLISQVESLNLPNGTENSLLAKLNAALNSFQNGNEGAAANKLNAFINAVNAQSGNNIDANDASELIATAQTIIDEIENGNTNCNAIDPDDLLDDNGNTRNDIVLSELLVYPNPTSGMFNIELYADKEAEIKVVVIDMMGSVKLVKESSLYRGENIVDVDISQLNSGVYFIKVVGNNTELTTPIILIR